ncbi:MAG: MoxR family ATPase, partial [Planctomycetota bacterium]|nr:MoxR family ATPase [Planctomycetota bacterium]
RIHIGYPSIDDEETVLRSQTFHHPLEDLSPVLSTEDVARLQEKVKAVKVDPSITRYVLQIAATSRSTPHLEIGVSPRGTLSLRRAAQARAYLAGHDFVTPDDVKALVVPVLAHRVIPKSGYGGASGEAEQVLREILAEVPVPV